MLTTTLPGACFSAVKLHTHTPFTHFAKWIDAITPDAPHRYGLQGYMIPEGTIDLELKRNRAVICYSVTGSRKNQSTSFAVVVVGPTGVITPTDIHDSENGWDRSTKGAILRMRKQIEELLVALSQDTEQPKMKVEFETSPGFASLLIAAANKYKPGDVVEPEELLTAVLKAYID